jgi:hypothetical protein
MSNDQQSDRQNKESGTEKFFIKDIELGRISKKENYEVRKEDPIVRVLSPECGQRQMA